MPTGYKRPRKNVYKRNSIMFYFDGEKEKPLKYESKILMDTVNFCSKCQLERINNRAEGCYVCMNCGECEFCFFRS